MRTMCVGLTRWQSALLSLQLHAKILKFWVIACLLSCIELAKLPVLSQMSAGTKGSSPVRIGCLP